MSLNVGVFLYIGTRCTLSRCQDLCLVCDGGFLFVRERLLFFSGVPMLKNSNGCVHVITISYAILSGVIF